MNKEKALALVDILLSEGTSPIEKNVQQCSFVS